MMSEPDTLASMRPHKAVAYCEEAGTFDRWFDGKLRSRAKVHRTEAGGE